MSVCATCGHPNDPDAQHCQTPDCECPRYEAVSEICPECDHVAEEHDAAGCREWTPTWPRLVRCGCKLPYGDLPAPPYPSARVRAALAEAYDRSAPPMGWPYPERVTQA